MKLPILLLLCVSAHAVAPSAVVLPKSEIQARAEMWQRANPHGIVSTMTCNPEYGAGQSMKPLLLPNDRMFFEPYVGQKLKREIILIRTSWCKIPVAHMVMDETKTHVFLSGLNNRRSDGWIPKYDSNGALLVMGVLAGVLRPE